MDTAIPYLIITAIFLLGLLVLELSSRFTTLSRAVIRKSGHVGLAGVIAASTYMWDKEPFILLGFGFTIIALLLRLFPLKSLEKFKSSSYGEALFPLGVALSALVAPSNTEFIIAILVLGLADTAAYIVGKGIRSPKLLGSKTIAGTLAFMVVSASVILIGTGSPAAFIIAPLLALIELLSKWGSDNVIVPLATSFLLIIFV